MARGWRLLRPGEQLSGWVRERYADEARAAQRWGFEAWVRDYAFPPEDPDPDLSGWQLYIRLPDSVDPHVLVLQEGAEFRVVIHRSAREPGRWQVTDFGRDGEPWSDRQVDSLQDALDLARKTAGLLGPESLEGAFVAPNPRGSDMEARTERRRLSRALREALNANEVYRTIDRNRRLRGSSPLQGACWPVARAIRSWLGVGELGVVRDSLGMTHHVFVRVGKLYFDGDGVSTRRTLQRRWRTREGVKGAEVGPMPALAPGLVCPVGVVRGVAAFLHERLGDSSKWGALDATANPRSRRSSESMAGKPESKTSQNSPRTGGRRTSNPNPDEELIVVETLSQEAAFQRWFPSYLAGHSPRAWHKARLAESVGDPLPMSRLQDQARGVFHNWVGRGDVALAWVPISWLAYRGTRGMRRRPEYAEYARLPPDTAPPGVAAWKARGVLYVFDGNTRVEAAVHRGERAVPMLIKGSDVTAAVDFHRDANPRNSTPKPTFSALVMSSSPQYVAVSLPAAEGFLWAQPFFGALYDDCRTTLEKHGLVPFLVGDVSVGEASRGRGAGVALYIAAAREVARYGGALVASSCVVTYDGADPGEMGYTSPEAERVWSSRALAKSVDVVGRVAMATTNPRGPDIVKKRERQEKAAARDGRLVGGVSRRRNPLVEPLRSMVGVSVRERVEGIEVQWRHAVAQAQSAYEQGRLDAAQTWDERAEELADQLDGEAAAIAEDFDAGEGKEAPQVGERPLPGSYFAGQYAAFITGRSAHFSTPAELAANLRAFLSAYDWGSFDPSVSDEAILEAARDAYEAQRARLERQAATREGRSGADQTFADIMRWKVVGT